MVAGSKVPDREALRSLTLQVRRVLDRIVADSNEADQLLGELEEAAGLVDGDGKRYDEDPNFRLWACPQCTYRWRANDDDPVDLTCPNRCGVKLVLLKS